MNLKYFLLPLFVSQCGEYNKHNNNDDPILLASEDAIMDDIVYDIYWWLEGKQPLSNDIKTRIKEAIRNKKVPNNQKEILKNIEDNLGDRNSLRNIINIWVNSDGTQTIVGYLEKQYQNILQFSKGKKLYMNNAEIIRNIRVYIDNKIVDTDRLTVAKDGIYYKHDSKIHEFLFLKIEINSSLKRKLPIRESQL